MANYRLGYIETDIIHSCNLNCRGCSHFSPLYGKDAPQKSLAEFERELQRLQEVFEIDTFRIMGGEPMLRDDFMDFMLLTKKYFPNTRIELATNGTLIEKLYPHLQVFKDNGLYICFSMYHSGSKIDEPSTLSTIQAVLGDHVSWTEKGGMYNIGLDLTASQDPDKSYEYCYDCHLCRYLRNGKIYVCPVVGNLDQFQKYFNVEIPIKDEQCCIDIFTHSDAEIVDFLNNQHSCCAMCKTNYRNINLHPWAVSKKEISEWTCR